MMYIPVYSKHNQLKFHLDCYSFFYKMFVLIKQTPDSVIPFVDVFWSCSPSCHEIQPSVL